jgi:hypothetical protein
MESKIVAQTRLEHSRPDLTCRNAQLPAVDLPAMIPYLELKRKDYNQKKESLQGDLL